MLTESIVPALSPTSTEQAGKCCIWASINLANTFCPILVIPWDPTPSKLSRQPKLFPVTFPYKWPVLAHTLDYPKISRSISLWLQCDPYFLLSGPGPVTGDSWSCITAWPLWAPPSPAQVAVICRLLCSSFQEAPGRAQMVTLASTSQEALEPAHLVDSFRSHESTTRPPQHSRRRLSRHQSYAEISPDINQMQSSKHWLWGCSMNVREG